MSRHVPAAIAKIAFFIFASFIFSLVLIFEIIVRNFNFDVCFGIAPNVQGLAQWWQSGLMLLSQYTNVE
jgi:hypothetical protein